jgi:pyruvate dehydrogenase E1 component alpha subunit
MPRIDLSTPTGRRTALERMLEIRRFEEAVKERFADGEIPGFVHLSLGQEAVPVGACGALEPDDYVTGTHRGHGQALARGLEADRLMAELYGKRTGYCGGKGGSMHVADLESGMLGAQPIVGASVPLATGAALTAQVGEDDWVAVAFLGDGAVAAGQVHEAMNLGATWELPVVYLVENNRYSEGMAFDEQHNVDDVAETAAAYGIPGETVDGQDVEAVYEVVREARRRATAGEGPTLVEAETYRYRGHFEGDPEPYRDEAEVREWQENRDPVDTFVERLVEAGELDRAAVDDLRETVEDRIRMAVEYARESDPPAPERAYDDVFAKPVPEVERFQELLQADGGGR